MESHVTPAKFGIGCSQKGNPGQRIYFNKSVTFLQREMVLALEETTTSIWFSLIQMLLNLAMRHIWKVIMKANPDVRLKS